MRRLAFALLLAASPVAAAPADDFKALLADHWAWTLKTHPLLATSVGVHDFDSELGDPSLAATDRQAKEAAVYIARLDRIGTAGLSDADRTSAAILRRSLATQVEADTFSERAIEFSNRGGWHTYFADLPLTLPFFTKADYDHYLDRLEKIPAFAAASTGVSRIATVHGDVLPCSIMGGFETTITGEIKEPAASRFYVPFVTKPGNIAPADWAALQARATAVIRDRVNPAYTAYAAFYRTEYAPKCRTTIGASALPNGAAYYAFKAREQTTTTMTPDEIHRLGLSEVARIRAEMDTLVASTGFKGDRAAYIAMLRTDPKYYATTPHQLMAEAALVAKTVDGWMPKLFGHLPRPHTVREIPAATADGTTTAYYNEGSTETGVAGTYYVNTTHLDQRPLFELVSLTIHEAVPGHHNQISLAQELDLPPFRRYATFFTAFVEGWGLYSERLGLDMGLYDTPEKQMGRLSYEMWRACRLVVDTGIHAKGWSKAQAVAFMADNTALSASNIDAEVNRYIADPGQALAYKIGELTIRRLRTKAETELGPKFDIRGFHDAVLEAGAVPMDVLEARMNAWIAARKG